MFGVEMRKYVPIIIVGLLMAWGGWTMIQALASNTAPSDSGPFKPFGWMLLIVGVVLAQVGTVAMGVRLAMWDDPREGTS